MNVSRLTRKKTLSVMATFGIIFLNFLGCHRTLHLGEMMEVACENAAEGNITDFGGVIYYVGLKGGWHFLKQCTDVCWDPLQLHESKGLSKAWNTV